MLLYAGDLRTFVHGMHPGLAHKTCLCILGYIAYICNRVVDASQANLLKNALT